MMEGLHPLLVCHDSYLMDSEEKNWVLGVGAGGGFFQFVRWWDIGPMLYQCDTVG